MSERRDAEKMIKEAIDLGFTIFKSRHGGYAVIIGDRIVTRIPANGNARSHWQKRVRRDMKAALDDR